MEVKEGQGTDGRTYMHYIINTITYVFTQITSKNIGDDHVITFQAPEHFKGPYSIKP